MTMLRKLMLTLAAGALFGIGAWGSSALASHQFGDVPTSSAFHDDVGWLAAHGIASGFPDGTFHPNDPVNRQQASRWLRNLSGGLHLVHISTGGSDLANIAGTASCGAHERALNGGGAADQNNLFITDSSPDGNGWSVRWETENNAHETISVTVYALCG